VTRYEQILRGGAPGSEARGMVIGSALSLGLAVVALALAIVLGRSPRGRSEGPFELVMLTPARELLWCLPAFFIAARRNQTAVRNGLAIALALILIVPRLVLPFFPRPLSTWASLLVGPLLALLISLAVKEIDAARGRMRSPR
jgi:hypothetical protein